MKDGPSLRDDLIPDRGGSAPTEAEVGVIMPVRNGMPFLPEAVDSILRQSDADLCLVVVNNGSSDGTRAYLDTISDRRVYVIHSAGEGTGAAENIGIAAVRSEFIARMDADDIALPGRLAAQVRFMRDNPTIGAVGAQTLYFSGSPQRLGFRSHHPLDHDAIVRALARGDDALALPTVMFRAGVLRVLGGHRILGFGESLDLLLRVAEVSRLANLAEPLLLYRVHPSGTSIVRWRRILAIRRYTLVCRRLRTEGRPEPSLDDYLRQERIGLVRGVAERLDCFALSEYRAAVCQVLDGPHLAGWARLAVAAAASPRRVLRRCRRELRHHLHAVTGAIRRPRRAVC